MVMLSLAQLLTSTPPETPEMAYRRGYRDGWIVAIDTMFEMMNDMRLSRKKAYEYCFRYFDGPLFDWMRTETVDEVPPPEVNGPEQELLRVVLGETYGR